MAIATETNIITSWVTLANDVAQKSFLTPVMDVALPKEYYSFFADRIPFSSEGVKGLQVYIPFRTKLNSSIRPTTRTGFRPTGSPEAVDSQNFTLKAIAGAAQVTDTDIEGCQGNLPEMIDLVGRAVKDIYTILPRYYRHMLWTPASGICAVSSGVPAGTTVGIDNAGLWNTVSGDRCKNLWRHMWLAVLDSTFVYKGVVQVVEIDAANDQFIIDADLPAPNAIANDDVFVISDIGAKEHGYNLSSPGILDMIDDNNTWQGVNRATAGNRWARALMDATGGLPTYEKQSDFYHNLGQPAHAITDWRNIRWYWEENFRENRRYTGTERGFDDKYEYVQVDKTRLMADDDALQDYVLVPDLKNTAVYTKGELKNFNGEGWKSVPERWYMEYCVKQFLLLGAKDCREMGAMTGIDRTAAS